MQHARRPRRTYKRVRTCRKNSGPVRPALLGNQSGQDPAGNNEFTVLSRTILDVHNLQLSKQSRKKSLRSLEHQSVLIRLQQAPGPCKARDKQSAPMYLLALYRPQMRSPKLAAKEPQLLVRACRELSYAVLPTHRKDPYEIT